MRSWALAAAVFITSCAPPTERSERSTDNLDQGLPAFDCASALGTEVAKHVWPAADKAGTVPRSHLYTSRNTLSGPYIDSKEIWSEMGSLIESARYEVDLETYEWGALFFELDRDAIARDAGTIIENPKAETPPTVDDPTAFLLGSLVRLEQRLRGEQEKGTAAALPVRVHIAIDGLHRSSPLKEQLGNMSIFKARALHKQLSQVKLDSSLVEVHVGAWERMAGGSLHSKLLVVDGYRAMVTGANPQEDQMLSRAWHDSAYVVSGEAGRGLQAAFDDTWSNVSEAKSCQIDNFDPAASSGFSCSLESPKMNHHPQVLSPAFDEDAALAGACAPVTLTTRREVGYDTIDPRDVTTPQDRAFIGMLSAAVGIVRIETPNLNAPMAKDAVIAALERGAKVQIVLPLGFNSDAERKTIGVAGKTLWSAGGSNEDVIRELYSRIARREHCSRLDIRFYSRDGARPSWRQEKGWASHTKYMSIDGLLAMVGSANHDVASWAMARESNILVDSAETTKAWDERLFDRDFAKAIPVRTYAMRILDGTATKEGGETATSEDLNVLFAGDPNGWARTMLEACGQ